MNETIVSKDTAAVIIPDGIETIVSAGTSIFIQQVLGGMFTVQDDKGRLLRIDGKLAKNIDQPVPDERFTPTKEEVIQKGLETIIYDQLKTCYDPEIPVNIVELGLIYGLEIKDDIDNKEQKIILVTMTLTAPGCGMGEVLKSDVEKKILEIPFVKNVLVDLVFDPAWDASMMSEGARLTLGL